MCATSTYRDSVVVNVTSLARNDLSDGNALLLGLVRKHGPRDDVTDGPDRGDVGAEVVVDLHATAVVELDADLLDAELVDVGSAANGHEHAVRLHLLGGAALGGLDRERHGAVALLHSGGDLRAHLELHALLLEDLLELSTERDEQRCNEASAQAIVAEIRTQPRGQHQQRYDR